MKTREEGGWGSDLLSGKSQISASGGHRTALELPREGRHVKFLEFAVSLGGREFQRKLKYENFF